MSKTLHILTKQQIPSAILNLDPDSAIVLIKDAVYLSLNEIINLKSAKIYALINDMQARGLNIDSSISTGTLKHDTGLSGIHLTSNIELIDYHQFVNLVIKFQHNVTW